jgi:Na+/H+ antiporter NhaC
MNISMNFSQTQSTPFDCGIIRATFEHNISTNFKITFILSIILIIIYQWLGNYLRKKLKEEKITQEQFLNISYFAETLLYLWYILIFFQIYILFLSRIDF